MVERTESSRTRGALVLAVVLALTVPSVVARADLPPPIGYEETCTRALQEEDDEYCTHESAYFDDVWGCIQWSEGDWESGETCSGSDRIEECCATQLAEGWEYRCSTYGASYYDALWCRARQPGDPERPEPEEPCTIEARQQPGEICVTCSFNGSSDENCSGEYDDTFEWRCSSFSGTSEYGTEVLCSGTGAVVGDDGGASGAEGGDEGSGGGCAVSVRGQNALAALAFGLVALAALLSLRRRPSRPGATRDDR